MIEKRDARRIQDEIRNVLVDIWDPIGIKPLGGPRDEYDSYIGDMYGMLARGATDEEIATELLKIERQQMGLTSTTTDPSPVIVALRAIKLDSGTK